jgi:hypothetical protein
MPLPSEIERHLTGEFSHGCCMSMARNFGSCLCFVCFEPCALSAQRRAILDVTGEPYVCCGGTWPCCGFDKPRSRMCLALEVCFCPSMALGANRFLVQTRLNKRNAWIDDVCKVGNLCVSCEFCLLKWCCGCTNEQKNLVKAATCIMPCAHCQNADALSEFRSGAIEYKGPPEGLYNELPKHFSKLGKVPIPAPVQMQPI